MTSLCLPSSIDTDKQWPNALRLYGSITQKHIQFSTKIAFGTYTTAVFVWLVHVFDNTHNGPGLALIFFLLLTENRLEYIHIQHKSTYCEIRTH